MSGKRRKQQRSRGRHPASAVTPKVGVVDGEPDALVVGPRTVTPSPSTPISARPAAVARPAASRYANSVSGPRRIVPSTATTGTIDIDERVPYFSKDLQRIIITAALMMALIIVGSLFLR